MSYPYFGAGDESAESLECSQAVSIADPGYELSRRQPLGSSMHRVNPPTNPIEVCIVIDLPTLSPMLLSEKTSCASASMLVMLVQAHCKLLGISG